jgi:hypothetical protein
VFDLSTIISIFGASGLVTTNGACAYGGCDSSLITIKGDFASGDSERISLSFTESVIECYYGTALGSSVNL